MLVKTIFTVLTLFIYGSASAATFPYATYDDEISWSAQSRTHFDQAITSTFGQIFELDPRFSASALGVNFITTGISDFSLFRIELFNNDGSINAFTDINVSNMSTFMGFAFNQSEGIGGMGSFRITSLTQGVDIMVDRVRMGPSFAPVPLPSTFYLLVSAFLVTFLMRIMAKKSFPHGTSIAS
jgi:hypothetical protein